MSTLLFSHSSDGPAFRVLCEDWRATLSSWFRWNHFGELVHQ
jgi:hypothetical protein